MSVWWKNVDEKVSHIPERTHHRRVYGAITRGCLQTFFFLIGVGSDVSAMTTTVTKSGSCYLINGTKSWITNGMESTGLIVFASTDISKKHKGISSFLVKKDFPGES